MQEYPWIAKRLEMGGQCGDERRDDSVIAGIDAIIDRAGLPDQYAVKAKPLFEAA